MSLAPARRSALDALARIRRDEAFSGAVLSAELSRGRLSGEDAALATRLTYGVLAAEGVLDEAIDRHARGSLEPRVRDALRLASFEMLFGRAPVYAVVDQGVEAARHARPQAARLANAVLRRLGDEAASFPWGDPTSDRDALARESGTPRWIVDLVLADLGDEHGRELLACASSPSATGLPPSHRSGRRLPFSRHRMRTAFASTYPREPSRGRDTPVGSQWTLPPNSRRLPALPAGA